MLHLLACGPLVPDEYIVPGELPTEETRGRGALALREGELAVLPGALAAWFDGGVLVEGRADGLYRDGELIEPLEAHAWAGEGPYWIAATEFGVVSRDLNWPVYADAVATDGLRYLALFCEDRVCTVLDLGEAEPLSETTPGGDVALFEGVAWWTNPMLGEDHGEGVATSEHGDHVWGLPGDNLRRMDRGWVVGNFNADIVPNRGRAIHLASGLTLAIERGSAGRPLDIAAMDGRVVLAVPEREVLLNIQLP